MANNFNWVNAITLNGTLWDNGTLSSVTPITQIGTLTIGGSNYKYLNTQLNNTGTIIENHLNYYYQSYNDYYPHLYFQNGAILNNSGTYELQQGSIVNSSNSSVGTFNNSGTFKKTTADTATIGVAFNNTGTVNVESGTLTLSGGGATNGGTFDLTSDKTLEISNSVYTFSNGAKINGSGKFLISGGTLKADGNWTLPTTTNWVGGTFQSSNIITNSGTLTIGGSNYKYLNTQLNNTGTIIENHLNYYYQSYNDYYPHLYFQNGAILNNSGTYELQQGSIVNSSNSSVGTFNNSGTFKKTTAATATIGVAFNNTGTVNVESGTLTLSGGGATNGGTFDLTSDKTLEISNSVYTFSNGAKINGSGKFLISGGTLKADGNWTLPTTTNWVGGTFQSSNIITNSGTLTIGGSNYKYLNTQLNNTGTIIENHLNYYYQSYNDYYPHLYFQNGAILNNSGTYELQQGSIVNSSNSSVGTFNNSGTFKKTTAATATIGVAFNNTGTVNVESGTLTLSGGGATNGGTFDLTSDKTLEISNSVYTFSNGAKINGSGKFLISGGTLKADGNWTLPTTTNWVGGTFQSSNIITNSGTLTIGGSNYKYLNTQLNNTGTIIENHLNYYYQSYNDYYPHLYFQNGAILNNSGTYELQQGSIVNSSNSSVGTFNNSGTFKKTTAATATIGVAFNNTGTVNVESGTLTLSGGGATNGGTFNLTSDKTLEISNSVYTFSNGAKINGSGKFLISGGTLKADGNWTLPTTTNWVGGTFQSSNIITNSGTLTIGGSNYKYLNTQLNNTGTIIENHLNYYYQSYNDYYPHLYFQNGAILNNSGIYELQQGSIVNSSNSSVGTFNNSGTFKKTTAATATIGVAFNNTGTVNVESGTLTLSGGGATNGGTFDLTSDKTLEISNSVYTFSNGAKINGSGKFLISGGTLKADGNWTLPTTTNWVGGTFQSSNIITNSGTLTIGGSNYKYLNTQLNNTGTIIENHLNYYYQSYNDYYPHLYFQNGAILNNSGIYELQQGSIVNSSNSSVGTFNNSGTFKKTTAATATIGVAFNNTGIVEANLGSLNFSNTYTQNNANLVLKGGNVSFSNALTVNGGSIEGNGNINVNVGVTNSGLLNPRYASNTEFGRLTINSNYTETNSARINIQLGGSTAGTNFDQVDINGTATFDGTLNVSLLNSFTPTLGSTFDVLTYDSLSLLSNLDFTGLDINSTLQFLPQWFNDKLTLKVVDKSTITNINVTTNQDVINASDGVLSLREAVIEANQNSLDNTIILGAQTYALNFSGNSDDNLAATGDLDILPRGGRLTIQGQGANQTFITATNLANLFQIHAGATINFSNVTIINSLLNDTVSVSKNVPLNLNVLNNDKSLKSQSIWLDDFQTTSVKGGTITRDNNGTPTDLSDDRLIYNPVAEFTGQDSFTYNITDGVVKEQATVTLNVANDAPPAVNERLNTPINTAITFAILTNNRDYNGDIINFESFQNSSTFGGTITKLNNQLTYTPNADFSGPDTFSYKVNDGLLTTQSTVTVLVNAPPNAVITTTQDTINYTDGLLSLREAIIQANSANIDSKITLGEGTYALAINGANEDLAATGDLDIKLQGKTLTIQGQGKNKTILDANSLDRFFQIHSGATVILSGVTINKGLASYGGAVANNGTLTILDSDFVNNQSIGAKGANGANGADGVDGFLYISEYVSAGRNATAGENGKNGEKGGDGKGGGIYNSGILTISNSLIENNKVTGGQGGIGGNGGLGGVNNSLVGSSSGYKPNGTRGSNGSNGNAYGGAIYNENTGSILINGGQFFNNIATPITGGTANNGDVNGIYNNGGTVTINSTVIESAGNTKLVKDTANKYFAQFGTNTPISIKISGQQIYQNIYSGWQTLAAETVNGDNQVLWKNIAGNYLLLWHLDNNWNVVSSEGNWGLNSTEAFTQETNFGIDANGDGKIGNPYTAIESVGNTKLVKDIANKYFAQVGTATPTAIKNGGQQLYQDIYIGWQTIAAETVNGDNQVLWKNVPGNYLTIWHLDNNWNGISYEGQWGLNSAEALTQETNFGIDTNGDGIIGNPYTAIESAGNTKLVKDSTNKYFTQVGTNTPTAIKNAGQQIYQNIYAGWQTLAAETINGDNQVLWKNTAENFLLIWHLDSNWNLVSGEGNWALNSAEALTQETKFGIDTNGDGIIGNPYTAIESAGNTKLVKDSTNKYFTQVGTNTPTAIKNAGQQIYQNIYAGWQTLAAETVNGDNQVLWKNTAGNFLLIWHLDSNWNLVSGEGNWALNSADALTQETNFGIDANGDGVIGYTPIELAGNTKLVKDSTNKYFTQVGTNAPSAIKNGGQQIYQDIYTGWQTLAAETVNGDNQVLWKNTAGNFLLIWHLDSNWNLVSGEGNWALNSAEALTQETKFGIDANGDGVIGYTPIELAGNTKLVKDSTNKYFTQVGTNAPSAIKNGGQQIYQNIYAGWQTLAAETVNGDNQVLWKNTAGNFLLIWHLDSNWNLVSGEGNWALNSAEALTQETVFGIDANGDGSIGNPSSLTLTGTSANDFLVGGANNDLLTGAGGKDTLTGGLGNDKFVYQNLSDSLLANFDVITDFNATTGNDLFRVSTARAGFVDVGAVNTLNAADIGAKLTAAAFGSNFAAQFSFGQKTFVAINDATAGFNSSTDAIIEIIGLTGTLNINNFVIV